MLMSKCLKQSKKISHIGMRVIIFMMLFVVANNMMVIDANALVFDNFTGGGAVAGAISTGNGYFDDDASFFGYTGNRNVYAVAELKGIYLVEPVSWANHEPGNMVLQVVNSSLGTIGSAVINNGYMYFVDGTTLKKKRTRSNTNLCESTDTTAGGCTMVVATGVQSPLSVWNNQLYFYSSATSLSHLDINDNVVSDFAVTNNFASTHQALAVVSVGGVITAYVDGWNGVSTYWMRKCTSITCTTVHASAPVSSPSVRTTYYVTSTYVYEYAHLNSDPTIYESLYYLTNDTALTTNYITTDISKPRRAYVGGMSTIGLISDSITYSTFNSNEVGVDSIPTIPKQLTYTTATIQSLHSTYYNTSNFKILYKVAFNRFSLDNILLESSDYRWQLALVDPNGIEGGSYQSAICAHTILGNECSVSETLEYSYPGNGWLNGTWRARLYEVNIIDPNRALIATSSTFTVLNVSLENQSGTVNPTVPINTGGGATALTIVDDWTAMFGLGVNPISKFMFAMMWITAFSFFGFIATKFNLNGGIMMALFPFTFFIYIEYLPLWTVVIITMIVGIKLFR